MNKTAKLIGASAAGVGAAVATTSISRVYVRCPWRRLLLASASMYIGAKYLKPSTFRDSALGVYGLSALIDLWAGTREQWDSRYQRGQGAFDEGSLRNRDGAVAEAGRLPAPRLPEVTDSAAIAYPSTLSG